MAVAIVNVLGEQFSWAFPAQTVTKTRIDKATGAVVTYTDTVPYATTLTAIRDALVNAGLPVKEGRELPTRWVFMRALQSWIEGTQGGAYDHKISQIIASRIPDDGKPLSPISIQIDKKTIDRLGTVATVEYLRECTITLDRSTDTVRCDDSAVEGIIRASMAYHRETRDGTDVGRIVHRLMEKNLGHLGMIPWNGRGTYFILDSFRATLDKVCAFLSAVGATTTRIEQYEILPYTPPNGSTTQPNGTAPQGNQAQVSVAVSEAIEELLGRAETEVFKLNRTKFERDGNRLNAEKSAAETLREALDTINSYGNLLAGYREKLADHAAYVERLMRNRATDHMAFGPDGAVVVETPTVETVAVTDGADDETVLENENVPSVSASEGKDFRSHQIQWHTVKVTPTTEPLAAVETVPLSVLAPSSVPLPGEDYIGEDGFTYRAPRNPEAYAEMIREVFSAPQAA